MIAFLKGQVRAKVSPRSIIVDVAGVGYLVQLSPERILLAEIGSDLELYCVTVVREDSISIFGFFELWERNFFDVLLGVRMVGPSLAMQIASSLSVEELLDAIESKSTKVLTSLPGVGEKSANRILVDLDSKISAFRSVVPLDHPSSLRTNKSQRNLMIEVEEALSSLGFDSKEIRTALARISEPTTVEDGVRLALAELKK